MESEIFNEVIKIVEPFVKNKQALASAGPGTSFLSDLQVSSARLVDIILAIEDQFGIEIKDEEADGIYTLGSAVEIIQAKQ